MADTETFDQTSTAAFDVDTWIRQAARPRRLVTIYGRADLLARLDDIEAEANRVRAEAATTAGNLDGVATTGEHAARLEILEAEWRRVAQQFAASALEVVVQGLTEAEEAAAYTAAKAANPDLAKTQNAEWHEAVGLHVVAAAIVSPRLTFEQVVEIHARIGAAAFAPLPHAARELSRRTPAVPSVPFSRPSSEITPA